MPRTPKDYFFVLLRRAPTADDSLPRWQKIDEANSYIAARLIAGNPDIDTLRGDIITSMSIDGISDIPKYATRLGIVKANGKRPADTPDVKWLLEWESASAAPARMMKLATNYRHTVMREICMLSTMAVTGYSRQKLMEDIGCPDGIFDLTKILRASGKLYRRPDKCPYYLSLGIAYGNYEELFHFLSRTNAALGNHVDIAEIIREHIPLHEVLLGCVK